MPRPFQIPSEIVQKWQQIVDLLAEIIRVPSALVMRVEPPDIKVFVTSESKGNPYEQDEAAPLNTGLYCETVMKTRQPLLVPDALADEEWKSNPDIKLGMISYLGFPVTWPNGEIFGTICVLDNKKNEYSELYQRLMLQCRDVLQADLRSFAKLGGELTTQKAHLDELFTRVPEAIVLLDAGGRVARINPEFTKIFGYTEEEVLGRPLPDLIGSEELSTEAEELARGVDYNGEIATVETVRRRKNGTPVRVSILRVPVTKEGSQISEYAIYRDITESKRAEEALQKAQADLAHINRVTTMDELASSLAHELNQPIAAAITNANTCLRWLAQAELDEAREAAMRIVKDGTRAAEIISRIRSFYKKSVPGRESVDVNQVAREMLLLLRSEANRYSISMRTALAAELPKVIADRVQLQQVFMNLMLNGIDAMREANGTRELTIKSERGEAEQLVISVSDTGVGLPKGQVDQIFNTFFTTKPQGTGMGLPISRSIVESHGGRLWAAPNAGRGTTFCFSLPTQGEAHE